MDTLIGLLILGGIWIGCKVIPNKRYDNYLPPEGYEVDHNLAALDRVRNHLTKEQVMRNTVNGKYNVKSKKYR